MSYLALIENHPCPQSRSPWNHSLGFPANKTKNIIMLDKTKIFSRMIDYCSIVHPYCQCLPKIFLIWEIFLTRIVKNIFRTDKRYFCINHFYLRWYGGRCPGIFIIFTVKVGGVAVIIFHHSSSLQSFKGFYKNRIFQLRAPHIDKYYLRTGVDHGFLDSLGIFPWPLLYLLVHLGDLLWVHSPQTALPLVGSISGGFLDLLKTFVEGQVVPHGVLPAARGSFEVRKVFTGK